METTHVVAPGKPATGTDTLDAAIETGHSADWRFLLPEALPARAAYVGERGGALLEGLRGLCEHVEVHTPGPLVRDPNRGSFDLVLVEHADAQALQLGAALLATGGWLYAELDRRRWPAFDSPERRLAHWRLADARLHWHFPDFDACRCVVPLQELVAGVRHLRRSSSSLALGLLDVSLRLPFVAAALSRLLPCISLIARKAGPAETS